MSNYEANHERTIRSIEAKLRGLNITNEQANRLFRAAAISAATATDKPHAIAAIAVLARDAFREDGIGDEVILASDIRVALRDVS